jgi:hypothetical protein
MNTTTTTNLSAAAHALFMKWAAYGSKWCLVPRLRIGDARRDSMMELYNAGLLRWDCGDHQLGVVFSDSGIQYAAAHGMTISTESM